MSEFEDIKEQFLRGWANYNPSSAFSAGRREYAGLVGDNRQSKRAAYKLFLKNMKKSLDSIDYEHLGEVEKMDYLLLDNKIDADLFMMDDMASEMSNPMTYTEAAFIFDYLMKAYAPLDQRMKELATYLGQLPEYYDVAITNLNPQEVAVENATMAVSMMKGMIHFFNNLEDECRYFEKEDDTITMDTMKELTEMKELALSAFNKYLKYLEDNMENFKGNFRLGKERYSKMLRSIERVDIPVEKILEAGMKNLEHNLAEFRKAASMVDPDRDPKDILEEITKDHPTSEELIDVTQGMLEEIRTFLKESKFVSVPSDVMPKVIYTPKPFREWAFAAMDTPGALEKKATESYYYVTPPGEDWKSEEQEEWLRLFNYRQLLDISVHECFPGHYLHHLHNQRSASLMAKLFGAYHFWEGYALYVEEAMYQHGFHKDDPKYRMMQLIETLIRNVRLICSIRYHTTDDFSVEEATNMFMEKCFMGRKPAESEAKRGTYDWGYLNYALGKLMIEKMKKDYKNEMGDAFSELEFHDKLLSYGAPPIPILRKFMIKNDTGEIL